MCFDLDHIGKSKIYFDSPSSKDVKIERNLKVVQDCHADTASSGSPITVS